MKQVQFLRVVSEAEARARIEAATGHLAPGSEAAPLGEALGRVLAEDVTAPLDVPAFDRSDVDGFAVRAEDTAGADEMSPVTLAVAGTPRAAGAVDAHAAAIEIGPGSALGIATGAALPRGADAVVMVEHTDVVAGGGMGSGAPAGSPASPAPPAPPAPTVLVRRPVTPGDHVSFAGTDIGRGDVVLRAGLVLTSRETGILAALGLASVPLVRRPRVLVLSTGDEVRAPGTPLRVGEVYDSNQRAICDAAREAGAEPIAGGVVPDDETFLRGRLARALERGPERPDLVVLSGGTSKGAGDLCSRVVERLASERRGSPGIVVHGVAVRPGKPFCFAVVDDLPLAVLPGFPLSALFTFQELVAPLVRRLSGQARAVASPDGAAEAAAATGPVEATLPLRLDGAPGRTTYTLVSLVDGPRGLAAYPLGSGSGSVSAVARADGYVRLAGDLDYLPAGARVRVRPLGGQSPSARDLVAIGSHCTGLDALLARLARRGYSVLSVPVGSEGGLAALGRGEGCVAGVHLLCPRTGVYNLPFLPAGVEPIGGYGRRQGLVYRPGDRRFAPGDLDQALRAIGEDARLRMVHRNRGSGTRVLVDGLLERAARAAGRADGAPLRPPGYRVEARSHHAVAAAVAQGRADWGVTLDGLARAHGLGFLFVQAERYDLVAPRARRERPAVRALAELIASEEGRAILAALGFEVGP